MDRRKAIRNIAIASGGIITLPQWMISCGMSDTYTHKTSFSRLDIIRIAGVADAIIPTRDLVGAIPLGVDAYLIKMLDDCYERNVQDNVKTQIKKLEEDAKAAHNKIFAVCTQEQREKLLLKYASSENKDEKDFFDLMKSETIRGFNTSQKVMQEYLGYKIAPGHYYGSVDVNSADHA